jgi:hypothetical protein
MPDIHCRDDRNPGLKEFQNVLPAKIVPAAIRVPVRQFIDEHQRRTAGQDGFDVHILAATWYYLQTLGDLLGERAAIRFDETNDDIGRPAPATPLALVNHREGFADARSRAEIDAELSAAALLLGLLGLKAGE